MSFFKVFFLSCFLFSLAGCGFQPLYGKSKKLIVKQELGKVRVASIKDRVGQLLHNLLLDRLTPYGRPTNPKYTLNVVVSVTKKEIGLKFTEEATRATLTLTATYFLTNDREGNTLIKGEVRSVNSYNISASEFARISSEQDATKRAAREVSDEIRTRLSLYFSRNGG